MKPVQIRMARAAAGSRQHSRAGARMGRTARWPDLGDGRRGRHIPGCRKRSSEYENGHSQPSRVFAPGYQHRIEDLALRVTLATLIWGGPVSPGLSPRPSPGRSPGPSPGRSAGRDQWINERPAPVRDPAGQRAAKGRLARPWCPGRKSGPGRPAGNPAGAPSRPTERRGCAAR